ncbi:MAG: ribosome recycling factor [Patescibacteria group bacterium]|nr:ribosome recycling factor [Patescibacteria group bacterium]
MDFRQKLEEGSKKALEHLRGELANIRTGRAHTGLVEDVLVDVYGAKTPLKQVANITVTDAKSISVQPWDKGNLSQIENALRDEKLSLSVVNTGDAIHVNVPELTEERRNEYKRVAKEKAEEAKVSVRNIRQGIWDEVKKAKSDGDISEDEMYRQESEIQKIVDDVNKEIEEIYAAKEKELSEV